MNDVRVTIDDWATWTGNLVVNRHRCSANTHDTVGVLHRAAGESGPEAWTLSVIEEATEDDVRKGVAPELSVPARCFAIPIGFCPFCGGELAK